MVDSEESCTSKNNKVIKKHSVYFVIFFVLLSLILLSGCIYSFLKVYNLKNDIYSIKTEAKALRQEVLSEREIINEIKNKANQNDINYNTLFDLVSKNSKHIDSMLADIAKIPESDEKFNYVNAISFIKTAIFYAKTSFSNLKVESYLLVAKDFLGNAKSADSVMLLKKIDNALDTLKGNSQDEVFNEISALKKGVFEFTFVAPLAQNGIGLDKKIGEINDQPDSFLKKSVSIFKSFFVIKKVDNLNSEYFSSNYFDFFKGNLLFSLSLMEWSVLNGNSALFKQAVENAINTLKYMQLSDNEKHAFLDKLQKLQSRKFLHPKVEEFFFG